MTTTTPRPRPAPAATYAAGAGTVRVACYLRISTDEEHQPFSLGAQETRLAAFVASQPGWEQVKTYTDQFSGAYADRPALTDALRDARLGRYDILLVYRVDRFARSLKVLVGLLEELDTVGVAFRSATEPIDTSTATGRMLVQLLGVFAEFERATIIDRVVAGMERKAARGGWPGGTVPYGLRLDDEHHLAIEPTEFPIVERIFTRYGSERAGALTIATELNNDGHRTRTGRRFSAKVVLGILRNRGYLGEVSFRDVRPPTRRRPHRPRPLRQGPSPPRRARRRLRPALHRQTPRLPTHRPHHLRALPTQLRRHRRPRQRPPLPLLHLLDPPALRQRRLHRRTHPRRRPRSRRVRGTRRPLHRPRPHRTSHRHQSTRHPQCRPTPPRRDRRHRSRTQKDRSRHRALHARLRIRDRSPRTCSAPASATSATRSERSAPATPNWPRPPKKPTSTHRPRPTSKPSDKCSKTRSSAAATNDARPSRKLSSATSS